MANLRPLQLAPGVHLALAPDGAANSAFLQGSHATLVVDAQTSEGQAQEVLGLLGHPPRYLVETHVHGDHTFGAAAFPPDCQVIAHRAAACWAEAVWDTYPHRRAVARLFFGERLAGLMEAGEPAVQRLAQRLQDPVFARVRWRPADLLWDGELTLRLGPPAGQLRLIDCGAAHSPSDTAVWLPDHRVLIAGDLVFAGRAPFITDPTIDGWLAALDRLAALDPATVVPGHGAPGGAELLAAMRQRLTLLARAPDPVLASVSG